ncbi:MAG: hypothetical protein C0616_01010 [Desulfuromonas sp.]|nr:MAG: hypothetical protein C0616_01010 [Desulfuromonas sp.]
MRISVNTPDLRQVNTLLFDLDGTLLQVPMERFIPAYLEGMAYHLGFNARAEIIAFARSVRGVIHAMLARREADSTNEDFFLQGIEAATGIDGERVRNSLAAFCADGLNDLEGFVAPAPFLSSLLAKVRERRLELALATNPVFPMELIRARMNWGGLTEDDFVLITSYENTRYCKPQPGYFEQLLDTLQRRPEECLMIGNDTEHDLAAAECGIATFLLDTWMIDRCNGDFSADFRGSHDDLLSLLDRVGVDKA